ncbi:MAG TPA: oligosaccharide flippase family protein, partial [Terriglobales bacterium]|nr:oligosaccharide flippase family protein [Terriglobales bacterium]
GQAISITMSVILAWMLMSVWALAIGIVIGTFVQTVLGHILLKSHGHAIRMERESLHSLVRFGRWIFLATLITFLGGNGMQLVQAKLVSIDTLGKLYVAGTIGSALGDLTNRIATAVGFPALANIARGQPHRMRSVLDRIRVRMFIAVLPGFIALSLISGPLIHTLYDARYAAASNYLAIIAITSAMSVITVEYQNAFIASGNSRIHFIVMSVFMILRLAGIILGFYLGGVEGMLVGSGVAVLATYFVTAYYAQKAGWLSPRTDSVAITVIFLGACVSYFVHGGTL